MPWNAFKRDNEWCVYKLNADDEPEGETLGCHATEAEARQQVEALYANEKDEGKEQDAATGMAFKVLDAEERIIEGYAATWDEDDEGETFDPGCDFALDRYMQRPVLLWHHGGSKRVGLNPIGRVLEARVDQVGLWIRAQLYKANDFADWAWEQIKQGVRNLSVGARQSTVYKVARRILKWPLVEISVEDFAANPHARFEIVKSLELEYAKALGLDVEEEDAEQEATEAAQPPIEPTETDDTANVTHKGVDETPTQHTEAIPMSEKETAPAVETPNIEEIVGKAVADALALRDKALAEAEEAAREEQKRIDALVEKRVAEELEKKQIDRKIRFSTQEEDEGLEFKQLGDMSHRYDSIPTFDMALGYMVMKGAGERISADYMRGLTGKAAKELRKGQLLTKSTDECFFRATKDMELARMLTKADELHGSDVTSAGDEWVPVYYSRELFPYIRGESKVLSLFRQVEVEGESLTFPIQTGAATWYKTAQADDAADLSWDNTYITARVAKVATSNMTLTPGKLSALSAWTGELDEQSLVPMLPFLRQEFITSGKDTMDDILINGDETTGATNISDYGNGAIATTWHQLVLDGLRHEPIVTTTANSRDGGTLTAEDFLATKKLMGSNGYVAADPAKVVWIMDIPTWYKSQALGEALTRDKMGERFTFQSGLLTNVFGSPVIYSWKYGMTDTSGYVHNTTAGNVKGSFMCVQPDQMLVGFGRRLKVEVQRVPAADAWYIVAHMSLDFDMASAEACAITYNLTV